MVRLSSLRSMSGFFLRSRLSLSRTEVGPVPSRLYMNRGGLYIGVLCRLFRFGDVR